MIEQKLQYAASCQLKMAETRIETKPISKPTMMPTTIGVADLARQFYSRRRTVLSQSQRVVSITATELQRTAS